MHGKYTTGLNLTLPGPIPPALPLSWLQPHVPHHLQLLRAQPGNGFYRFILPVQLQRIHGDHAAGRVSPDPGVLRPPDLPVQLRGWLARHPRDETHAREDPQRTAQVKTQKGSQTLLSGIQDVVLTDIFFSMSISEFTWWSVLWVACSAKPWRLTETSPSPMPGTNGMCTTRRSTGSCRQRWPWGTPTWARRLAAPDTRSGLLRPRGWRDSTWISPTSGEAGTWISTIITTPIKVGEGKILNDRSDPNSQIMNALRQAAYLGSSKREEVEVAS